MRSLDILIYTGALGFILAVLFLFTEDHDSPPAPPATTVPVAEIEYPPVQLPAPSPGDEQVVVMAGQPQEGVGTAFAVNTRGDWLTARHVVEGCSRVTLQVSPGNHVPVAAVRLDDGHDLALLSTGRSPFPVRLDLDSPLHLGDAGFMVGYPQGHPGELAVTLAGRSRLVTRGNRSSEAPIIAWTERGRTEGLSGTLGGISGGPVFDAKGNVRGVIVAESPRRGRIYTTTPDSVRSFLDALGVAAQAGPADAFSVEGYGKASDAARRRLQVVMVTCEVAPS